MPFDKRVVYLQSILVFKALNNLAPSYIREMLTMFSDVHNANTRNAKHNLILPKVRTKTVKNSFRFTAARSWNEPPRPERSKTRKRSVQFSVKQKNYLS